MWTLSVWLQLGAVMEAPLPRPTLAITLAPQTPFLCVSKLTGGPFKCSGAASSLGAALPRLTLALRRHWCHGKCWLTGFETDGCPQMLRSSFKPWSSLADSYPRLPWPTLACRGTAKCFFWVSKLTDGPLKRSGAPPSCDIMSE